jgi:hypothetical protein
MSSDKRKIRLNPELMKILACYSISRGNSQLVTHARMYAMSTKYLIETLQRRAKIQFLRRIVDGNIDPTDFAAAITVTHNTNTETDSEMGKCVSNSIL